MKEEINEKKRKLKGKRLNGPIISKIFYVIEKKIDERLSDKNFSIEEISEIWNESALELNKIFNKNNKKSPKEEKREGRQEEKKKEAVQDRKTETTRAKRSEVKNSGEDNKTQRTKCLRTSSVKEKHPLARQKAPLSRKQ